jgi:hypothetical protein
MPITYNEIGHSAGKLTTLIFTKLGVEGAESLASGMNSPQFKYFFFKYL